jgi:7,8-dihydropterin-6-yl-methyl-4-(beta-D-ribofuranosyl)aminobenzene 5'-phosphate synthase
LHKSKEDNSGLSRKSMTRLTILVDNNVLQGSSLIPEHGFAALIERGSERILFDTGQGSALVENAAKLHKDLANLTCVILSHGHYDHTGGLLHVVNMNPGIRVVAHPAVFSAHMKLDEGEKAPRTIGIPHARLELENVGAVFEFAEDFRQICQGVWFSGHVPRIFKPPPAGALISVRNQATVADSMEDDTSLVMETPSGACVVLGCAHAGVRNILEHVRANLGIHRIHAVIGGTHLGPSDKAETFAAIRALEDCNVQVVAPAHCTGSGPTEVLRAYFGSRYCEASAGAEFVF